MTALRTLLFAIQYWIVRVFVRALSKRSAADLIERCVAARPTEPWIRFEGRPRTFAESNATANRVAHWALEKGIGRGDVVALLMDERPEALEVAGGLAKVGATVAVLPTDVSRAFAPDILARAGAGVLIFGEECAAKLTSSPALPTYWVRDARPAAASLPPDAKCLDDEIQGYSSENPPRQVRADLRGGDAFLDFYEFDVSGGTVVTRWSHARFLRSNFLRSILGIGCRETRSISSLVHARKRETQERLDTAAIAAARAGTLGS